MLRAVQSDEYKEIFRTNLRTLCDIYIANKDNNAKSYANVYSDIKRYCKENGLSCFAYITFKKWLSEDIPLPDSYFICLLCDFFGCDANYLFAVDSIKIEKGSNQSMSNADKYIFENYGLDRQTLEFLKKYKDYGVDSVDDSDLPHTAASAEQSFSALLNDLIHQAPWLISALFQVVYAERLNLSSYGFADIESAINSYPDFPGISGHLVSDFDMDVSISALAIRLKQLLLNPHYMPNENNPIETYDAELLNPGAVDEYISNLLSTRLKKLNGEITTLTEIITKDPIVNAK